MSLTGCLKLVTCDQIHRAFPVLYSCKSKKSCHLTQQKCPTPQSCSSSSYTVSMYGQGRTESQSHKTLSFCTGATWREAESAAENRTAALQRNISAMQQRLNNVQADWTETNDPSWCHTHFSLLCRCNSERLSQQQRTGLQLCMAT